MVCPCLHFHVPSVNTYLNVFCAYFCCNDLSSSRIANFPATGKRTGGYSLLVVVVILPIAISSGRRGRGGGGGTTFSIFVK